MKKFMSCFLIIAIILTMGIGVMAYSDVEQGTNLSEAVSVLSGLEIIEGFEDGTFKPEETVTRAQMAAIICRTIGYEEQAQSSNGSTVFNDVADTHWASGYINVAQSLGIINGYGDGNFGPEDKVTYEQAVKMIVSALGYDLAAQSKGGYPSGYLAIASAKGITKSANGRIGDAAKRDTIAVLVYNSLEVELMDQTSWSTGAAGDEYGMTEETILSRYLGIKKYEGVVKTTPLTEVAAEGFDPEAKAVVEFDGLKEWKFENKSYVLKTVEGSLGKVNATLVADADKYLGKKVVAYISAEAEVETGEKMIYAIAEKQGANATLKLNAGQLVSDDEAGKLVYKKPGSNKKYDVTINIDEDKAWKNFNVVENSLNDTDDIMGEFTNGGTLELIDSDTTQNGYESIIITDYNYEAVVEEVEVDDTDVFFTLYTGDLDDIDMESETELVMIYKDGEVVEATAIVAGDTVTTAEIDADARVLYVSSKNITGSVDGWSDEKVTIAGEEYAPSAASGYSLEDLQNKEGIFYLNVDGQISFADASASKGGYAFFLNSGKDGGVGSKYYATIVGADGEAKVYNYAKNVIVDGVGTKTAEEAAQYIATRMGHSQDKDEAYAYVDTAANLLFEVKIKNGEIKNLKPIVYSTPLTQSKYNADTKSLGAKTFDGSSVMFALAGAYNSATKIEEEDIKVGKVVEMLADDEQYYVALPTTSLESGIYKVAVGYDLVTSVSKEGEIIVITGKKTISYNDDVATVITGLQAGKEVEIILYNEDGFRSNGGFSASLLAIGDIILTSTVNTEKVADDFVVVFDKSASDVKVANDATKNNYYGYQLATNADDNFIWFDTAMEGITEAGEGSNYMVIQKTANTVLVDYEEDADEPEISKKSLSKSLIGRADKYDSYVFVRVIDEVIVDVVVYRNID